MDGTSKVVSFTINGQNDISTGTDDDDTINTSDLDGDNLVFGDTGDVIFQNGDTVNIVMAVDVSGSMSSGNRIQALKEAINASLEDLYASGAENARVHIVAFGTSAIAIGTYDLVTAGQANATELDRAQEDVNNLEAGSTAGNLTNYEAELVAANNWIESGNPLSNADKNTLLFVSDGQANRALDDNGNVISVSANNAMDQVLGIDDESNEVALIETDDPDSQDQAFDIQAVGINLNNSTLEYLSQIEGPDNDGATNVQNPADLTQAVGEIVSAASAGADTITSGAGNDVIFGDVPNTNELANSANLSTPVGSGWTVFLQLEDPSINGDLAPEYQGWDREDTIAYLLDPANHLELRQEEPRIGGSDTINAGAGNDIVFGQEGNDTIFGQEGNDEIYGGSGSNTLNGGSGNDVFVLDDINFTGLDTIEDYVFGEDEVDISALLDPGVDVDLDNVQNYVQLSGNQLTIDQDGSSLTTDDTHVVAVFENTVTQVSVIYDDSEPSAPIIA